MWIFKLSCDELDEGVADGCGVAAGCVVAPGCDEAVDEASSAVLVFIDCRFLCSSNSEVVEGGPGSCCWCSGLL